MSAYANYGMSHEREVIEVVKPSVPGFFIKYLASASPLLALIAYRSASPVLWILNTVLAPFDFVAHLFGFQLAPFAPILSALLFLILVAWVMHSDEATASLILTILMCGLTAFIAKDVAAFATALPTASLLASAAVLIRTEIFRRSIEYVIDDVGIEMIGGLVRRQRHRIPYNQIGRVVVERSVLGRLLNYGTVIPVGIAEWGAEYYTRALGGIDGVAAGYARTVKEVARDPLKCLYGVKNPDDLAEKIGKMISVPFRAEVDQVEYLRKIYEAVSVS